MRPVGRLPTHLHLGLGQAADIHKGMDNHTQADNQEGNLVEILVDKGLEVQVEQGQVARDLGLVV